MINLPFVKMSGLGNDFVLVDAISSGKEPDIKMIIEMADRHMGVGCDQVLWLSSHPNGVLYRIFNPDGSEVSQCGNGARCVGYYMSNAHNYMAWPLKLHTRSGKILSVYKDEPNVYKVNMGSPTAISDSILDLHKIDFFGKDLYFQALDIGNPHAIFKLDEDIADFDLEQLSSKLSGHILFPEGVNISIINIGANKVVKARVFERGAGETLACGSAASAILAALGLLELDVVMPGGKISTSSGGGDVFQAGDVTWVFVGNWQLNDSNSNIFYFDKV